MVKDIWNLVFFYLIDLIKVGLIFWGIFDFQLKRDKFIYFTTGILAILSIIAAGFNVEKNRSLVEAAVTVILLLTICNIFQGRIIKKLIVTLLVYVCVIFFDICVAGIISLIYGMTLSDIVNHDSLNFIGNTFNILVISIIVFIKKRYGKMHFKAGISGKIYALFFTGAITGVYFVGGLMLTNLQGAQDRTRKIILAVMMVASFAYFAACLMLVMISESRDSYKMLSQINQTVIEAQQKYYLLANEKEQEIKSIRHEIKNHLACINGLYHNNKLDEMNDYISQLIDQTQVLDGLLDTGNDIVNAILNDAQSRYQKDGIMIKLEGAFPKDMKIAPMDLCVIFANAVSNAVEAIQKIEHREDAGIIHIKISVFKNDLFIDIWNPVASKVEIVDGKLRTTKQDKNLHGFGTANMIQRVEKYHGTIDFENKENLFYVHINMKNE